jgi:putative transposase
LIGDRDGEYPELLDAVLADAGLKTVLTGLRMPSMNAVMERWTLTCRRELLDRTLIWNQRRLLHALREFDILYNRHRPHQGIANTQPWLSLPPPINDPAQIARLDVRRRQRLGGILNEYEHVA